MAEAQNRLPVSKVERAMKFVTTGAKISGNYLKHFAQKAIGSATSLEDLDEANAELLFQALGELKGGALKLAQMLSMDRSILPKIYTDKFSHAHYNAPPLSYPLVVKTFQQYLKKSPTEIFDSFSKEAVHAASIGQVHWAYLGDKALAVKVQYPGIADSIISDLHLIKPIVLRLFRLNEEEAEAHFQEIAERLLEETDYRLEWQRGMFLSDQCQSLQNIYFPTYYPNYSCERILTMDWLVGCPLNKFIASDPPQSLRNQVGQAIWDLYNYQVHRLHVFHADPHPGNFLVDEHGRVGVVDFGCVKQLPVEFYRSHMRLLHKDIVMDDHRLMQVFKDLQIIYDDDTTSLKQFLFDFLSRAIRHVVQPFFYEYFDFSNQEFITNIIRREDVIALNRELFLSGKARGQRDAIYLHRTFYGLYHLLYELKATVRTRIDLLPA